MSKADAIDRTTTPYQHTGSPTTAFSELYRDGAAHSGFPACMPEPLEGHGITTRTDSLLIVLWRQPAWTRAAYMSSSADCATSRMYAISRRSPNRHANTAPAAPSAMRALNCSANRYRLHTDHVRRRLKRSPCHKPLLARYATEPHEQTPNG